MATNTVEHKLSFSKFTPTEQQFLRVAESTISRHLDILLSEVKRKHPLSIDTDFLQSIYVSLVADKVILLVSRAAVLEMNLARLLGHLQGSTPQERFNYFFEQLNIKTFFEQYSVLNQLLETTLLNFNNYLLEILENYATEWRTLFPEKHAPPKITAIKTDIMDVYPEGRSIVTLLFENAASWVYKPRDLAVDAAFQIFLAWFNAQELFPPFKMLKIVCHENHSWCEFVEHGKNLTPLSIKLMYDKIGALLCLLYVFEANDMHPQNIFVVGDTPVLIDLETVLQPRKSPSNRRSVMQTDFLPEKKIVVQPDDEDLVYAHEMHDNLENKTCTEEKQLCWKNEGQDTMQIIRRRLFKDNVDTRFYVDNQPITPTSYVKEIAKSFRKTYRFIETHKEEFLSAMACFKHLKIRFIVRDTSKYAALMEETSHPLVLSDVDKWGQLLSAIDFESDNSEFDKLINAEEKKQLKQMTIPSFSTFTDETGLYADDKLLIPDYFMTNALSVVAQNMGEMSAKDMEKQVRILRRQFQFLVTT